MKKRILACLLAAMMLMPALTGCGNTEEAAENPVDTAAAVETEPVETEPELVSGIPEGTTFGGETVSIWYTTKSISVAETYLDLAAKTPGKRWMTPCTTGISKWKTCWM